MVRPRDRYAAVINNQLDHSALISQLSGDTYVDHVLLHDILPGTIIESTDPALLALAPQLAMGQCCAGGTRQQILMDWYLCEDRLRVAVRPEHLAALAAAATLQEIEAARAAIQADTLYPPPPEPAPEEA